MLRQPVPGLSLSLEVHPCLIRNCPQFFQAGVDDLSRAFAGHAEALADLLECHRFALTLQGEAEADGFLLAFGQLVEDRFDRFQLAIGSPFVFVDR